ncbi:MAG TPA: tRNA pseudouridine(38-40) synthase TruA [Candidatus Limnocylindria bacterium]|nr:tRNA pseudouridine(38-40) synthase TruA [Candidatus Limnocylindria bacterium]
MNGIKRRYKAIIAYDGSNYHGWQVQPDHPTIARTLQNTFATVFGESIQLAGVSRTDAGVHARGQVASFTSALNLDVETMRWAWHNRLPGDIILRSLEVVPDDHNIYADVLQKTYHYYIFTTRPMPFMHRYGWHVPQQLDRQKLHDALQVFVGTHDFRAFTSLDEDEVDTVRTVDSIMVHFHEQRKMYKITVKGPSFLRYMIRRMVGAGVAVALRSSLTPAHVQAVLERKNPDHHLPNAPAQGLVLYKVAYANKERDLC